MFGSWVLEVAVGLIFVFLLFSTICAALREMIETVLKTRAVYLERGIREILNDMDGTKMAREFYEHPLIYSLYGGGYTPPQPGAKPTFFVRGRGLPSYIPSKNFAAALMDLAARGVPPAPKTAGGAQPAGAGAEGTGAGAPGDALNTDAIDVASLRASIGRMENKRVARALLNALDLAQDDLNKARLNLEAWYDGTMDRVSGWYKRSTQWIVLVLALVMAGVLNVDAIGIANFLYRNDNARHAVVAQADVAVAEANTLAAQAHTKQREDALRDLKAASPNDAAKVEAAETALSEARKDEEAARAQEQVARLRADAARGAAGTPAGSAAARSADVLNPVQKLDMARAQLDSLDLPIGWDSRVACNYADPNLTMRCAGKHTLMVLGWLLTALAATLGAPFWFDILNKVMVIRSTVKPYEKSKAEGSEDRQNVESWQALAAAALRQPQGAPTEAENPPRPPAQPVTPS